MKILFLIIFICLNISCSQRKISNELIRPWSMDLQKEEPFKYPFLVHYKTETNEVRYLAAKHSNSVESPTFKTIKTTLRLFKPNIIIIEGFSRSRGISPQFFIDYTKRCKQDSFTKCGESSYAIDLSRPLQIPFVGGEPSDKNIYNEVKTKGYTANDLLGFYTLRQIPQWKRLSKLQNNLQHQINQYINYEAKNMSVNTHFNYLEFERWYKLKSGKDFNIDSIVSSMTAPRADNKDNFFKPSQVTLGNLEINL